MGSEMCIRDSALEDPNAAANLMSIDFEKAFNRMSHPHCLNALERLNADKKDIDLVQAFLYGRTMRVKIGSVLSTPRTVPGGSPQGSILGNFLFCVATNELSEEEQGGEEESEDLSVVGQQERSAATLSFEDNGVSGSDISADDNRNVSPITRPPPETNNSELVSDISGSDDSFNFVYFNRRRPILNDTVLSERYTQDQIDAAIGVPEGWLDRPISTKVYIDDLNTIEKVKQSTAITTFSEGKPLVKPHAINSEKNFARIKSRAETIGMRVNSEKTQLLCITGNTTSRVTSYIRTAEGQEINSSENLKILGFWFGRNPNVNVHVQKLLDKFRGRLWSLRHLKKSGMLPSDLLFVYMTILRPVLDFAVPSYHPMLTLAQSAHLESLQKRALKIIYGVDLSYRESLAIANITTLKERREELTRKFTYATLKNPRYTDGWFPKKPEKHYQTRSNRPYCEEKLRTERMKKNPLTFMRRLLNDEAQKIE